MSRLHHKKFHRVNKAAGSAREPHKRRGDIYFIIGKVDATRGAVVRRQSDEGKRRSIYSLSRDAAKTYVSF